MEDGEVIEAQALRRRLGTVAYVFKHLIEALAQLGDRRGSLNSARCIEVDVVTHASIGLAVACNLDDGDKRVANGRAAPRGKHEHLSATAGHARDSPGYP